MKGGRERKGGRKGGRKGEREERRELSKGRRPGGGGSCGGVGDQG